MKVEGWKIKDTGWRMKDEVLKNKPVTMLKSFVATRSWELYIKDGIPATSTR